MNPGPQISAAAASDAYNDRPTDQVGHKRVDLGGQQYQIFGHEDDPKTGFHATAYQNTKTNEIIIAYRGTDPDIKHHTRTTVQDALVDAKMVRDRINPQKNVADEFTTAMLKKAADNGISKDQITVAGHSLGGTLAEIEAQKFGLHGATFNAYGAADLSYGISPGGHQVTNYVMAADVVSAASRHFGEEKILASQADIDGLHAGRYLGAAPGVPPPNPLLTMSLGDHSVTHFTGEGGMENALAPANIAQYEARYTQHKAAFDHFRGDVQRDRGELATAMNRADSRNIETTMGHLPPDIQRQLAEYHALHVDAPIHSAIEQNSFVLGVEHRIDQTSAAYRQGGQNVQHGADELEQHARAAGQSAERNADEVAKGAWQAPLDPVTAAGVSLGATATGYVARAEADGFAQASHLTGQAVHAGMDFTANRIAHVENAVKQGAHAYADGVTSHVHQAEATLARGIDSGIAAFELAETASTEVKQSASRSIHAAEHAVSQTYDKLAHPVQWFQHGAATEPAQAAAAGHAAPSSAHPAVAQPSQLAHSDPRQPDHPQHALYETLERRIPEASQNRLLQFTASCHDKGITDKNIGRITLAGGEVHIQNRELGPSAQIDIKTNPPSPQESIKQIQQADHQQAQVQATIHQMNQQHNQQAPQGPMLGGGPR